MAALSELHTKAKDLGYADPEHFVVPWHGRDKKIDPTKPMTSWRSAWRSLRKEAGLPDVRFHDGRHTALTRLAEAGQPVIQGQMGHVSSAMMKTYSHIRRKALDEAAAALLPTFEFPATDASPSQLENHRDADSERADEVTSQVTSQSDDVPSEVAEILKEVSSPHWTISATGSSARRRDDWRNGMWAFSRRIRTKLEKPALERLRP